MLTIEEKLKFHLPQDRIPESSKYDEFMYFIRSNPHIRIKSRTEINGLIFLQYNPRKRGGMHFVTKDQHQRIIEKAAQWRKTSPKNKSSPQLREYRRKALIKFKQRNPDGYAEIVARSIRKRKSNAHEMRAHSVRAALRNGAKRMIGMNGRYSNGITFLIWLAKKMGVNHHEKTHEIDHLIPLSSMDLTTDENCIKANSPFNIRWVLRSENLAKYDSFPTEQDISNHAKVVNQWMDECGKNREATPDTPLGCEIKHGI